MPGRYRVDGWEPFSNRGRRSAWHRPFRTPAWPVAAGRTAFAPIGDLGLDSPFAGTYVPLAHHRAAARVCSIMVEIRRDTYRVEPATGAARVARALAVLVDAVTAPSRPAGPPAAGRAP